VDTKARSKVFGAALVAFTFLVTGCGGVNTASLSRQPRIRIDSNGWSQEQKFSSIGEVPQDIACGGPNLCLAVFGSSVSIWKAGHWSKSTPEVTGLGRTLEFERATCPTTTDCVVVASGANGSPQLAKSVFVTYSSGANGAWSSPTTLTGADYYGIACMAATHCAAVGWIPPPAHTSRSRALNGLPAIAIYNGHSWIQQPQLAGTNEETGGFYETTCTVPDLCIDTDGAGNAIMVEGSSVKVSQPFPGDTLGVEVACANPQLCLAINAGGIEVSLFDGSHWTVDSVSPTESTAIGCSSVRCYMGDANGDIYWTLGGSWSKPSKIASSAIAAIACPATSFCMAATNGGYYTTMNLPTPD
jgi:hypothetical protein